MNHGLLPFSAGTVPVLAVLVLLVWLVFLLGGRHRWARRATLVLYLIAAVLAVGACALWLAGLSR